MILLSITVAISLLTTWRIFQTDAVFSQAYDEPAHISCGMEWLDRGTYTYETQHPPLARIAAALFPYLGGVRSQGLPDMWEEGNAILHSTGNYSDILARARWGILPFFLLLVMMVAIWGTHLYGLEAGLCAVIALSGLPVILTHAGRATTDLPFTAMFLASLFGVSRWIRQGGGWWAIAAGLLAGLALVTKFSFVGFFPISVLVLAGAEWFQRRPVTVVWKNLGRQAAVAAAVALLVTLIVYRFSVGPLRTPAERPYPRVDALAGQTGLLHNTAYAVIEWPYYPFRELVDGIYSVYQHLVAGNRMFFMGKMERHGSYIYFPTMLGVKTPIPFLFLAGAGVVLLVRRRNVVLAGPVLCALAITAVCIPTRINLGLRHLMPVYPLLALGAGFAAVELCRRGRTWQIVVSGLLASPLVVCWSVHPDYVSYFNVLAGQHPEELTLTDLDSGQDLYRLKDELRRLGVDRLSIAYSGSADLNRHGLPPFSVLEPHERASGWIAISTHRLIDDGSAVPPYDGYKWLRAQQPVSRAGLILIYRIEH